MKLREKLKNISFEGKKQTVSFIITGWLTVILLLYVSGAVSDILLFVFLGFPFYFYGGICLSIRLYVNHREEKGEYLYCDSWFYCFLPDWWRKENIEFKRYSN